MPPARPNGRDCFGRCPGERANDFHNPERLSSNEEPVRALPVTRRRAFIAPRSRFRFVLCGFPRRTRPPRLRSAATERSFGDQAPLIDSCNHPEGRAHRERRLLARDEAFHSVALANARGHRLRAARPRPLRAWVGAPEGTPAAPADGFRLSVRAAAQRPTRRPSGHPFVAGRDDCALRGAQLSTASLGSPSGRPRERKRPSC
jgi:hypothetical protein